MKIIKFFKKSSSLFIFFTILCPAFATTDEKTAGDLAQNILTGALSVESIIYDICIITGIFLVISSFFQYRRFRRNPSEMPIGRPITTLVVGLVLIALTFIPMQG